MKQRKNTWGRLEAGLLAMVLVLFLYTPPQAPETVEQEPEYRFRAVEILSGFADWLGMREKEGR